jgi:hypothetical protein
VACGVGQRLLEHAICGVLELRRERPPISADVDVHVHSRSSRALEQAIESVARRRLAAGERDHHRAKFGNEL